MKTTIVSGKNVCVLQLLILPRPPTLEALVPGQWNAFYSGAKPTRMTAACQQDLPMVPVITPADVPLPNHTSPVLPVEVTVERKNGVTRKYRLQRKPRILDWSPRTAYSDLVMFTVRSYLIKRSTNV